MCLSLHFVFSLTRTLAVSFLSKCYRKEPQRSSRGSNILPQRSSCAFIIQPQRSSCGFQNSSSSDPQSAARRTSSCGRKKKFLRVHYFWAVLNVEFKKIIKSLTIYRLSKTKQAETREGSQSQSGMGYLPETEAVEIPSPPQTLYMCVQYCAQQDYTKIVFDLETSSRGNIIDSFQDGI